MRVSADLLADSHELLAGPGWKEISWLLISN
jgi:hypothetical protein